MHVTDSGTEQVEKTQEQVIYIFNTMAKIDGAVKTYAAFQMRSFRENLSIPDKIWAELQPSFKEEIAKIRSRLHATERQGSQGSQAPSQTPTPDKPAATSFASKKLPSQYPTMSTKETIAQLVSSVADLGFEDDASDSTDDDMMLVTSTYAVRTCQYEEPSDDSSDDVIEVRAHLEYTMHSDRIFAITDGGADSCILGKNAKVISHTGRYATLIRYDPSTTRSGKIPIVSAYIKVKTATIGQIPILLKVHEAPYNQSSPITLLSEYQIREHGLVIDSVAKKHKSAHGHSGTQCFHISQDLHIDFEDRGGLMGFEILPIEDGDEEIFEIFTITAPVKWTPQRFVSDSLPTISSTSVAYSVHTDDIDTSVPTHQEHEPEPENEHQKSPQLLKFDVVDPTSSMHETQVYATSTWHRVIHQNIDPMHLRPYLGWRPLPIIKKTLENTTQMARMIIRHPLRRHVKARFPHMNVTRIDETVSTDPLFANCRSIYHGYVAAQVFYGTKSHTIFIYRIKKKWEFPGVYRDFIRDHGAPSALRRDNAKEEQSEAVQKNHREL